MNPRRKKAVAFRPAVADAQLEARALLSTVTAHVARAPHQRTAPRVVTGVLGGTIQGRYQLATNLTRATITDSAAEPIAFLGTSANVTISGSVRTVRQGRQMVLTGTIRLRSGASTLDLAFTSRPPAPGGAQVVTSNVRITRATGVFAGISRNTATRVPPRATVTLGAIQPDRTGDFQLNLSIPVRKVVR